MLRAKQLSLSISSGSGAAEALSFKLWDTDWYVLAPVSEYIESPYQAQALPTLLRLAVGAVS